MDKNAQHLRVKFGRDIARPSLILSGQSPREACKLLGAGLYDAAVYADAAVSVFQGVRGETVIKVRPSRRARRLARAAQWN